MKMLLLVLAMLIPVSAMSCDLEWDHPDDGWLEGFRAYQSGVAVGTVAGDRRAATCEELNIVPAIGPLTLTAFRGETESPHSDPATFTLVVPSVRITIDFN